MNEFQISRSTVRQAVKSLEQSDLLIKIPGRGTFVNHKPVQDWLGNLRSTNETIEEMGKEPGAKLVEIQKVILNDRLKKLST